MLLVPPVPVGDTVTVRIPSPDRARGDPRNIVGVVVEVIYKGLYRIGNSKGIINQLFPRNGFAVSKERFIDPATVAERTISMRGIASSPSFSGGQGFIKCDCKTGCKSGKCTCLGKKVKCNSKCHGSRPCANK